MRRISLHLSSWLVLPLSLSALAVGCSSKSNDGLSTAKGAALHRAVDCNDLLEQIQADAVAKLDAQVALYKSGSYGMGRGFAEGDPVSGDGGVAQEDTGAPAPAAPGAGNGGTDDGKAGPDNHSETNTQVAGVDEADIVKTDGERIYLLHGNTFFLIDAWPADESRVLGSVQVDGNGFELFVQDGKATIFSNANPTDIPGASTTTSPKPAYDCFDCGGYGGSSFTKIAVYDVLGEVPVLEKEMLFEGNYLSARRHGDLVRAVVQGGFKAPALYSPDVNYFDSFGRQKAQSEVNVELDQWRERTASDIETTELTDWIPRRFQRIDGKWQELDLECDSYFVPEPGRVQDGVTQVVTFDAKKVAEPHVVAILGGAQHVYANTDVLLLAQTDYSWNWRGTDSTRTALHQFAIADAETHYQASGFVPGYVHNQFSIDESAGIIRLSTTEQIVTDKETWVTETLNRVFTLQKSGKGLEILARTEPLGEEGETIFATRFVGDRGYVVTFRQTDPLIVVDLKNPKELAVLGELHIPGFSDYIHPLPNHQLLTIGQDTDSGVQNGVALKIFDVSNPSDPKQTHVKSFGGFSYSEASGNHKAFTFVEDKLGTGNGLLMFPITSYDPTYTSRLEVLQVNAETGFKSLGSIEHQALLMQNCPTIARNETGDSYCYYSGGSDMRRGLQIGGDGKDYVYAISYGGLTVHPLSDVTTQLTSVALPTPQYSYDYGYPTDGGPVPPSGGGGATPGIEVEPAQPAD